MPVQDVTAATTAFAFVYYCLFRWCVSGQLLTDRGSYFTASAFIEMCKALGVIHDSVSCEYEWQNGVCIFCYLRCFAEGCISLSYGLG